MKGQLPGAFWSSDQASHVEFATLAHEATHVLLHFDRTAGTRPDLTTRETEAEAVTSLLCAQLGITGTETSVEYIQSYRGTPDTPDASPNASAAPHFASQPKSPPLPSRESTNDPAPTHWRDTSIRATMSHADGFPQLVRSAERSTYPLRRRPRSRDAAARYRPRDGRYRPGD